MKNQDWWAEATFRRVEIGIVNIAAVETLWNLVKRLEEIKDFSDRLDGEKGQLREAVPWAFLHAEQLAWWMGGWECWEYCPDGTPWRERFESFFSYVEGKTPI